MARAYRTPREAGEREPRENRGPTIRRETTRTRTSSRSSQVDLFEQCKAMVHIEEDNGAAAFYLLFVLSVYITCLTPVIIARAVQGKKPYLLAGTVAAGVRRRRARRRMDPSAGAGRWRRVLENPPDRGRVGQRLGDLRAARDPRRGATVAVVKRRTGASRWRTTRTRAATRCASSSS